MNKHLMPAAALSLVMLGGCGELAEPVTEPPASTTEPEPKAEADKKKKRPQETVSQENARASVEGYLETSAFSRKGLIDQLKFEGYSRADAVYAVDAADINWKEQAAKSAQSYLDTSAFSRSGLISQLRFEGFTPAQAEHGADAVGLN